MAEEIKKEERKGLPPPNIVDRPAGRTYSSDVYTRKYLDSLVVEMRIVGSKLASTETTLFGQKLKTPVMFGVTGGYQADPESYVNQAKAAIETGTVQWLPFFSPDEEIKKCVDLGAKVIRVIKPHYDNALLIKDLKKAEALGCFAVASDLDHAYSKDGELDGPKGFQFGPKTPDDLREIVNSLSVPFIAKGILSVQDALACKEAGVAGIVISHHHGIMDCAVPPVMILPAIREAVGPDYPIIVDCSIDTGADAFKALALGADAVCTARAAMKFLAQGSDAMADFMRKMTGEVKHFLDRTSSPDVKHIDPSVIHQMPFAV